MNIPDNIITIIICVLLYYFVVLANFLPETVGCQLRKILATNMIAKHIVGLLLLYFLVILTNPTWSNKNLLYTFFISIIVYVLFLVNTRMNLPFILCNILLLIILYFLNLKKKEEELPEDKIKKIEYIQLIIMILLGVSYLAGFILYLIDHIKEYEDNFNLSEFIFGNLICKSMM